MSSSSIFEMKIIYIFIYRGFFNERERFDIISQFLNWAIFFVENIRHKLLFQVEYFCMS